MKNSVIIFSSEFPPGPGGLGNHAWCLAEHLYDHGFTVSVISVWREDFDRSSTKTFRYETSKLKSTRPKFIKYFRLLGELHRQVRKHRQPTVIASGMLMLMLLGFYSIINKKSFKALVVGHGIDINASNRIYRSLINFGLRSCDRIVAVSNYTARMIPPEFQAKTVVINNGFDTGFFSQPVQDFMKLRGTPSLVTVGSISARKGQQNVICSLPGLVKHFPDVHYHCIGIDTQKKMIISLAESLNVLDRITIYGAVQTSQLTTVLRGADIFVMLSEHTPEGDFEGFGIAILEANFLGIPAIGSRNSGIADAIHDQHSGILVDEHNPEEVINAVDSILNKYSSFSANAKTHATRFNWTVIVKDYIKLLDTVYSDV